MRKRLIVVHIVTFFVENKSYNKYNNDNNIDDKSNQDKCNDNKTFKFIDTMFVWKESFSRQNVLLLPVIYMNNLRCKTCLIQNLSVSISN